MSWQLASFLILGGALAGGFAWYERSHPRARVLALVAALAALAVVGRIAFAPFPNVKPTTDIVLFSGFALGGAPGFCVGALAALVSNLFFGQGPWTPWQMAAWGGVGLFGAVLGRLSRGREPGRLMLALACGLAGAAFGATMDVYQWALAAEQTPASYAAVSASSLPYNIAHVAGNVAFALLIGPAFVRALRRYRRRFEVRWVPSASPGASVPAATRRAGGAAGATVVLAALALVGGLAAAQPAHASSAGDRAATYLERAQNRDGGFGAAPGQSSSQLFTGWTALGLAAAHRNPRDVHNGGKNVIEFVRANAGGLDDTGELERTILVLAASGLSPHKFVGRDLVSELRRRRGSDGAYSGKTPLTAFAVMALKASGQGGSGAARQSARWLAAQQNKDGGFSFGKRGSSSDVDDTGAVLEALAAAGHGGNTVKRAVGFLRRSQHPSGGFGQFADADPNAQSTAWAVQGLVAAGRSPSGFTRSGGRDPIAYLQSLQLDNGSVRYSRTSGQTPVWVTAQALAAFERRPFPIAAVKRHGRSSAAAAAAAAAKRAKEAHRKRHARKRASAAADATAPSRAPFAAANARHRVAATEPEPWPRAHGSAASAAISTGFVGLVLVGAWVARRRPWERGETG
jgi:energy-coupling factor transport system substrate-specific component